MNRQCHQTGSKSIVMTRQISHSALRATAIVALCVSVAACTRSVEPLSTVQPLPPAPAGTVQSQPLNPAIPQTGQPGQIDPNTGQLIPGTTTDGLAGTQPTASLEAATPVTPAAADQTPLDRGSVAGVWNVQVAGGECRVATSFTRRSAHFQASPLRCPDAEMSRVREWDVSGNQMVLYDESGSAIARLFKTGDQRLDGRTSGGTAVTFSRS